MAGILELRQLDWQKQDKCLRDGVNEQSLLTATRKYSNMGLIGLPTPTPGKPKGNSGDEVVRIHSQIREEYESQFLLCHNYSELSLMNLSAKIHHQFSSDMNLSVIGSSKVTYTKNFPKGVINWLTHTLHDQTT